MATSELREQIALIIKKQDEKYDNFYLWLSS